MKVSKVLEEFLVLEALEIFDVVPVAALFDQLAIEIQEDELGLQAIPLEESDGKSEYLSVEVPGGHNLQHVAPALILQALLQVCGVVLNID